MLQKRSETLTADTVVRMHHETPGNRSQYKT